jgi:phosphatidylglycerophosphate synthase
MISPTIDSRSPVALRVTVAAAAVLVLAALLGLALVARTSLGLTPAFPLKTTVLFGTVAGLVLFFVDAHHPHRQFGAANYVTLSRAALVALLAAGFGEPPTAAAAWAAASLAGLIPALDGIDGWLARRARLQSAFGARFDMEIDALYVLVMCGLLWQFGKAGAWIWVGGALRYAFVAAGWFLPWLAQPLRASRRGRLVTAVHMVAVSVALAPFVPVSVSTAALAATTAGLCWSFSVDVGRLWRGEGAW